MRPADNRLEPTPYRFTQTHPDLRHTMHTLQNVAHALPGLYDPALSVKIVEVAKKYDEPEVSRDAVTRGLSCSNWVGRSPAPDAEGVILSVWPSNAWDAMLGQYGSRCCRPSDGLSPEGCAAGSQSSISDTTLWFDHLHLHLHLPSRLTLRAGARNCITPHPQVLTVSMSVVRH